MPATVEPPFLAAVSPPPSAAVPAGIRATLLLSSMMTVMAGAVVAAALPGIRDAFPEREDRELLAKLVLALPAAAIAMFAPVSGWVADRFGRKPLLVGGLGLYVVAGTTGIYLQTLEAVLAGRFALGIAVAMVMTASTTLVSDYFAGPARPKFLGLQASFMALGGVIFLPAGGLLAGFGWHAPFWVYLAGLPVAALAAAFIVEPARMKHAPGPGPAGDAAAVPWPTVGLLYAIGLVGMLAFYLGPVQVPFLMHEKFGSPPLASSLALGAVTLCGAITSLNYGRIAARAAAPWLMAVMFLIVGAGYTVVGNARTVEATVAGLMASGFGSGLLIPTLSTWLLRVAPPAVRGRLSGGLIGSIFVGQFVSPMAVKPLGDAGGTQWAFAVVGGVMLAVGVAFTAANLVRGRRGAI